jgi:hypothetical protein
MTSTFKEQLTAIVYTKLDECPEKPIVDAFKAYAIATLSGTQDEVCAPFIYELNPPVEDKDVRCIQMLLAKELPEVIVSVTNNAILLDPMYLLPRPK